MRIVINNVIANVFWMYFPVAIIWFSLSIAGYGSKAFEGPGFVFIACVMYGNTIQKFSDLEKDDIWAYRMFAIIGFSLSLVMAVIVSYDTYTPHNIVSNVPQMTYIVIGLALGSIIASYMAVYLETKYNKSSKKDAQNARASS